MIPRVNRHANVARRCPRTLLLARGTSRRTSSTPAPRQYQWRRAAFSRRFFAPRRTTPTPLFLTQQIRGLQGNGRYPGNGTRHVFSSRIYFRNFQHSGTGTREPTAHELDTVVVNQRPEFFAQLWNVGDGARGTGVSCLRGRSFLGRRRRRWFRGPLRIANSSPPLK